MSPASISETIARLTLRVFTPKIEASRLTLMPMLFFAPKALECNQKYSPAATFTLASFGATRSATSSKFGVKRPSTLAPQFAIAEIFEKSQDPLFSNFVVSSAASGANRSVPDVITNRVYIHSEVCSHLGRSKHIGKLFIGSVT